MPKPRVDPESLNHDSFLDIVANLVGVMIILVMLVGGRAGRVPTLLAIPAEVATSAKSLQDAEIAERTVHEETLKLEADIRALERQAAARDAERQLLATAVTAMRARQAELRSKLDGESAVAAELRDRLAAAERRLEQLQRETATIRGAQPPVQAVKSRVTPISQRVDGDEVHFQLRGGRITYVPLEQLIAAFRADVSRNLADLRTSPEMTNTVGPVGGFRMRYTMETKFVTGVGDPSMKHPAYAQLKRFWLIPVSADLGETPDQALIEGSAFRRALGVCQPSRTTITCWVYPDSFDLFRRLREMLYERGFAVAARPLPEGSPITGSPEGSESAAQ